MTAACDKYKLTKYLVIVESPAKCHKIEHILGSSVYTCIASFGHLRSIATLKDIDVYNQFRTNYSIIDDPIKTRQIAKIKEEIAKADEVILASDDDREGEAIAWHICMLFGLPIETTKRVVFHEITETAIQRAFATPRIIDMRMVYSQQARQIIDMLVGYTVSPLLWKAIHYNKNNALSAGRCQTPALRLVYDNYKEIQEAKGRTVYTTTGYFTNLVLPFVLNKEFEDPLDMEYFLEHSVNHAHIYTRDEPKITTRSPPVPFTTSRLQQAVSNEFHYSPKETMRMCQTLYEHGLITYMRTDSAKYSADFVSECKEYVINTYHSDKYVSPDLDLFIINGFNEICAEPSREDLGLLNDLKPGKRKKSAKSDTDASDTTADNTPKAKASSTKSKKLKDGNKKKDSSINTLIQEAHEAIRPTHIAWDLAHITTGPNAHEFASLTPQELKVYGLIWRNSLESLMSCATFSSFTSSINGFESNIYKYSSDQIVFPGWLAVANKYEKTSRDYAYLLTVHQGSTVEYKRIEGTQTVKGLKSHYSEAKLVSLMEDQGIGRPSTYASLVDKIVARRYVNKSDVPGSPMICTDFKLIGNTLEEIETTRIIGAEKGKMVIQPLGIAVIEFLDKHIDTIFNYEYTRAMEEDLDKIAKGDIDWVAVCNDCYSILTHVVTNCTFNKLEYRIDENHSYIIGKNGPVIRCITGEQVTFIPVKQDIDIEKLIKGELTLDEVADTSTVSNMKLLGNYKGEELFVKRGRYGLYATYGDNHFSLSCFGNRPVENITYVEVFNLLEEGGLLNPSFSKDQKRAGIVREISANISIRKGKYGLYVFYKTTHMKTPRFFDLKTFEKDTKSKIETCDLHVAKQWIQMKYQVN